MLKKRLLIGMIYSIDINFFGCDKNSVRNGRTTDLLGIPEAPSVFEFNHNDRIRDAAKRCKCNYARMLYALVKHPLVDLLIHYMIDCHR